MKYQPPLDVINQPDASYVNGDPSIARQGSIPPAEAFELPQREIVNLITLSQQMPSDQDLEQLTRGVRDGKLIFCVDQGPLNQIAVMLAPPFRGYEAGLTLRVLIAHTVTGPTTISINRMNPTSIKRRDGSELQQNDMLAGMIATLLCDGTFFQLQNFGEDVQEPGVPTDIRVDVPYVRNSSPISDGNHFIGLFQPPLENINEGRTVEVKSDRLNTGPMTFAPNNFPTHPICRPDGTPLQKGDIVDNMICWLMFDSEQWQLLTQSRTKVEVVRPRRKSVSFAPWTFYTNSCFLRTPKETGNRHVWTMSMFVRYPEVNIITDITNPWANGQDNECPFSAGTSQAGYDYTGFCWYGTPQGNICNQYWGEGSIVLSGRYASGMGPDMPTFTIGILQDIKWHHFMQVADGEVMTCYIDGIVVSQANYAVTGRLDRGAVNNAGREHALGRMSTMMAAARYGSSFRCAEFYLVDGQALPWTAFAENVGGVILPKTWTGDFGVNGCWLNFDDGSALTTTTLGKDYSGKGNNWQPVNLTLTQILSDYPGYEN